MTARRYRIAIVGATGLVGRLIARLLEERQFPVSDIALLSSSRSVGKQLTFAGQQVEVHDLAKFDFNGIDICFFSAGASVSREYAPLAANAGALVIDNTSCFRYDDDVPLVIPEINPEAIMLSKKRGIIANPNCSTMQMLMALFPIHKAVQLKRICIATYQAVSGAGSAAVSSLKSQLRAYLDGSDIDESGVAMNVLPHIDVMQANGYTKEEMKMLWETQKILDDSEIQVSATAVRVPVITGHSEAITIETRRAISPDQATSLIAKQAGVRVVSEGVLTPAMVVDQDDVFVSRIRESLLFNQGLSLWVVADNLRKGAATNAVQIAEKCLKLPIESLK